MQSDSSLSVSKPSSVWHRPIKLNFRELFKATGKGVIHGISGKWDDVAGDAVEAAAALGLESTPEDRLWLLIYQSLHQAMFDLLKGNEDLLIESLDFGALGDVLDVAIDRHGELQVDVMSLFKQPKQLPLLEEVRKTFQDWLPSVMAVVDAPQAKAISDRLPSYFVYALHQEWRNKSAAYEALKEQETPFSQATEEEQAWGKYLAWLQKQVDEPMFLEPFGLRQVYVPLRAYFEQKPDDQEDESPWPQGKTIDSRSGRLCQRVVVDLAEELLTWVEQGKRDDGLRVICGGPGCGKSSFTKIIAAQLAEQGKRVLFVPLHLFDPMNDLMKALANYIQGDLDRLLPPNPLDKDSSDDRVILIFDGLDELAMQGKVGAEIAKDFVQEIQTKLNRYNHSQVRVQVILSGRDLVVQANSSKLRGDRQVLHVLPYFINLKQEQRNYIDSNNLLTVDQRDRWWKNYGEVSGKGYTLMPQELQRDNLVEITTQPLLNYLLALSYQRKTLVFSETTNLNEVYADLLNAVYGRGWEAKRQHRAIEEISKADFLRILEEVALAAWHGNGRTTTIQEIQNHFANNKDLKSLLARFETGAEAGVTRLLTAFYFRQQGSLHNGDKTFEFTHKSFGEYLTAKAIVRGVEDIQELIELREARGGKFGWDEQEALKFWAELCGKTAIDDYLYGFIRDEIRLRNSSIVQKWQVSFCRLIEVMLRHGMPMERIDPRLSYQNECQNARNAEESLLVVLSSCATKTKQLSTINWGSRNVFGKWLERLRGQETNWRYPRYCYYLSYLNLSFCFLYFQYFQGANLQGANLQGANLTRADFEGANLEGADLRIIDLRGANLEGANLEGANLEGANLEGANLEGANLEGASLNGANLTWADFEGVNLEGASLNGANLTRTYLDGASLTDVSWDEHTFWGKVRSIDGAFNIPKELLKIFETRTGPNFSEPQEEDIPF